MQKIVRTLAEVPAEMWRKDGWMAGKIIQLPPDQWKLDLYSYPGGTDGELPNIEDLNGQVTRAIVQKYLDSGYHLVVREHTEKWLSNHRGAGREGSRSRCGSCTNELDCVGDEYYGDCVMKSYTETIVELDIKLQVWQKLCGYPITPE